MGAARPLQERFEEKYIPVPEAGCWLWTAAVDTYGYGRIGFGDGLISAHRVSWALYRGEIPNGLCVLHACDVPSCVNPDHLFLGTHSDNSKDCFNKGRSKILKCQPFGNARIAEIRRTKTHCKRGHPLAGGNLYVDQNTGYRSCRACKTAREKAYYERKKAICRKLV